LLREVERQDISIFFEQQNDPVASAMAAFPSRDRAAHDVHWAKILADDSLIARTDLVAEVPERPLHARVAEHNVASMRVLAKCGFLVVGEEQHDGDPVKEIVMRLDA
jgi:hypothetical protein